MIDWPWVVFGYLSFGSMALYMMYRSHIAALDKLAEAHARHVADLRQTIEMLQGILAALREGVTP